MDMNKLLQQAQQMKQRMEEVQAGLAEKTVDAESGGGMVKVTVNGKEELVAMEIDPKVVDPEEIEFLEDLVVAAIQAGQQKAAQMAESELKAVTGGLPLPGMF